MEFSLIVYKQHIKRKHNKAANEGHTLVKVKRPKRHTEKTTENGKEENKTRDIRL